MKPTPPPLPPRAPLPPPRPAAGFGVSPDGHVPYTPSSPYGPYSHGKWRSADPRTSSTQSLTPSVPDSDPRRTLLLIYIHGFYGTDQSFKSFPAHVHHFLREALADSHVIHSKIYPRYKTYRAIEVARDNFSAWLEPHESPTTDVILVGHSMGGLLAADVVLIPNPSPYRQQPFKHRILGTISLDSPFLGLHPGIIVSGISSLFQASPKPAPQDEPDFASSSSPAASSLNLTNSVDSQSSSPLFMPPTRQSTDPYFDPPFFNDEPFKEQPFLKRVMRFATKHRAEGLFNATSNHIASHLEFGGCLADYSGLHARYNKLRALEDVDELKALGDGHPPGAYARVRFVNYYTLSTGRPKPLKAQGAVSETPSHTMVTGVSTISLRGETQVPVQTHIDQSGEDHFNPESYISSPMISMEDHGDLEQTSKVDIIAEADPGMLEPPNTQFPDSDTDSFHSVQSNLNRLSIEDQKRLSVQDVKRLSTEHEGRHSMEDLETLPMKDLEPLPMEEDDEVPSEPTTTQLVHSAEPDEHSEAPEIQSIQSQSQTHLDLPPIPDAPDPPTLPDLNHYTDKDARKQAEKESKRLQKVYDQAVKNRDKALRERQKLLEKRRKKAQKEADKLAKEAEKRLEPQQTDEEKRLMGEQQRLIREKERLMGGQVTADKAVDVAVEAETSTTVPGHVDEDAAQSVDEGTTPPAAKAEKPKKQRKFCTLPSKTNGVLDATWVDVSMDGMDEVTAHSGVFIPGPHYDKLIGDVGSRVVGWVRDDMTKRTILDMQ